MTLIPLFGGVAGLVAAGTALIAVFPRIVRSRRALDRHLRSVRNSPLRSTPLGEGKGRCSADRGDLVEVATNAPCHLPPNGYLDVRAAPRRSITGEWGVGRSKGAATA